MFCFTDTILVSAGTNIEVAAIAKDYVLNLIPGLYAMALIDLNTKYLHKIGHPYLANGFIIFGAILRIIFCYLFTVLAQMGVSGIANGSTIGYILTLAF